MRFNQYENLVEATQKLVNRGFTESFKLTEDSKLASLSNHKEYNANNTLIVEYHRFEEMANSSDMSIIIALECNDGTKGTVTYSYENYSDNMLTEFMNEVKIKNRTVSQKM